MRFEQFDGSTSLPFKSQGKFHLGGKVIVSPPEILKNNTCIGNVLNPGKGVCADPVERGAILEVKGLGPPSGDSERQLSPDRGGGKT